jgi:hypothetical protein
MVVTLLSAASDKPQIYRNEEYGITLYVPKGVMLCPNSEDVHDHGPLMLLDSSDEKRCTDAESEEKGSGTFYLEEGDDRMGSWAG